MSDFMSDGGLQKIKGKLQSTWGNITDDDLMKAQGDKNKLVGTIKEKTGESEDEIRRKLDEMERAA